MILGEMRKARGDKYGVHLESVDLIRVESRVARCRGSRGGEMRTNTKAINE